MSSRPSRVGFFGGATGGLRRVWTLSTGALPAKTHYRKTKPPSTRGGRRSEAQAGAEEDAGWRSVAGLLAEVAEDDAQVLGAAVAHEVVEIGHLPVGQLA